MQTEQVHISRVFKASPERLFHAWTDASLLEKWYAPKGCTLHYKYFNFTEGGKFHSCIYTPDGKECWCIGQFKEIEKNKKIVFTMLVANEKGNRLQPLEAGMDPDWPVETLVTVTFHPHGENTEMILTQTVNESLAKRTGAYPSWLMMFDNLDEILTQ